MTPPGSASLLTIPVGWSDTQLLSRTFPFFLVFFFFPPQPSQKKAKPRCSSAGEPGEAGGGAVTTHRVPLRRTSSRSGFHSLHTGQASGRPSWRRHPSKKSRRACGLQGKGKPHLGAGGKMSSLGGPHLCPTGCLASAHSHIFLFQFYQPATGDFFFHPQKIGQAKGSSLREALQALIS